MNDLDLLFVFSKRETFTKYYSLISEHNVNKETWVILKNMDEFFKVDETRIVIDWIAFATWFRIKNTAIKADTHDLYSRIFLNLSTKTSSVIEKDIIDHFVQKDYLTRIADLSLRGAEGTKTVSISDIEMVCEDYKITTNAVLEADKFMVHEDIHGLISHVIKGTGLDWRLTPLNTGLGPLRKGDFVIITARPDAGKTTLLASESTFMASQLPTDKPVLWFNNEEEGRKVKFRIIQAAIGWSTLAIEANPSKAYEEYEKTVGSLNKILVYDRPSFSVRDINSILKDYNPGLIIFDQLRKVKGFEKESNNDVGRLQLLFQQAREWAKEYAPVIGVHQARGDAEGQRWIEMNQMHGSQTDIQGEVDVVVSLGRSHEPGFEKSRWLYFPKNKLVGGPKSDPMYRNGKFEITIKPDIARFESL